MQAWETHPLLLCKGPTHGLSIPDLQGNNTKQDSGEEGEKQKGSAG
jgi:hypothetical protein